MRDNTIYKEIIRGQIIDSCETTLSGILTPVRLEQSANAWLPMYVQYIGIDTSVIDKPMNA